MNWVNRLSAEERVEWDAFAAEVEDKLIPGMESATYVMSCPDADGQISPAFAVETGLAILMDKPIVVVSIAGRPVPPGLRRIAAAIIEVDRIDDGAAELYQKLQPVLARLKSEGDSDE